jgi:acyl-CoA reductase-like NAD-dependent aldehyde dehydrogenase
MNQTTVQRHAHYIGGKEVKSAQGGEFISTNPATGKQWGSFAMGTAADVDRAVSAAQTAFGEWARLSPTRRGRLLMRWADAIGQNASRIGTQETTQNGKLLRDSVGQASMIPEWLYYYGGLADKIEGAVIPLDQPSILNYTSREPLGVVGIITPWNSPAMLTTFAAAPALAAGNTIVIKPSEIASVSLLELARLAESAGIPAGVINVVTGPRQTGEYLIDQPQVARISFTGSVEGGRAVAQRAGRRLVGCTLELGGKSPQIVFADADLQQAEAGILGGIFSSTGQTCVAGSRAYIHRKIYDELVGRLIKRARGIRLGDPMLPTTQMGPVATLVQLDKNQRLVKEALDDGASLLYGGRRVELTTSPGGFFFEPTVLGEVHAGNRILHTEAFGPILAVMPFDDEEEAIGLANASEFGLGAGIWTLDIKRAHRVASRLQAGTVWINMYRTLAFNSPVPGRKQSGLGVQNGQEAILQYLQTKSVWCEFGAGVPDQFADTA